MQAPSNPQRSKRSAAADSSNPSQAAVTTSGSSHSTAGARTSSSSSRSSTYRKNLLANESTLAQPGQQLSQIERSVTHLLVATKQLLETLTQWSRRTATEGEVSDVYVRLGYEFNIACRAFNGIGVDTSDLGPVPELLRSILEETLSQEATPASLDQFLPKIRDIIISLLHGLKGKQQRLRAKQGKDNSQNGGSLPSTSSSSSLNTGLTQMLEDVPSRRSGRGSERRIDSGGSSFSADTSNDDNLNGDGNGVPPQYSSMQPTRQDSGGGSWDASNRTSNRASHRPFPASVSDSSMSNGPSLSTPLLSPPGEGENHQAQNITSAPRPVSQRNEPPYLQVPPPAPKQQDALAALQRGGDLERRASRRYSAYQISKHLGASPNGVPMLPPAQATPVPNRGRDVRDSMNAVRTRGSRIYSRQRSNNRAGEPSPVRNNAFYNHRISEESSQSGDSHGTRPVADFKDEDGLIPFPDQTGRRAEKSPDGSEAKLGATLTRPLDGMPAYDAAEAQDVEPRKDLPQATKVHEKSTKESDQAGEEFVPEQSPQPGKELTLFLQYKSKIKKFVLPEGSNDLTIARLQLAFIEKFAWNTHSNGNDLPEIYIQDPVSGVRHELEDLRDVKDRCVLVLNVEVLDEVKKHIDEGLGGLRKMVEGVRTAVDGQQTALQRVSERQQDTTREVTRLSVTSKASTTPPTSASWPKVNGVQAKPLTKLSSDHGKNIQSLRQDLAVLRQTFSSVVSDFNGSMSTVKESASSIKVMAIEGVIPNLDAATGRSYVNTGKKSLAEESEVIVNSVDDLQDIVEDLRKDVVTRGVRPLPRQLETVSKSISSAAAELKKMQEFLKREKPIWTKIWEKELEVVCNDRDLLTMQEELAADLEDDLDKATQTFALVEQATKQQNIQSGQGNGVALRNISKGLTAIASDQEIDPMKAKDGVLGEVRALRPNHETRLEAIERAEKARQRELETRLEGEFTKEVASFVEEGKLKKSGGVEEAERLRKAKDEQNRRNAWEVQQERAANKGKKAETSPPMDEPADTPPAEHTSSAEPEQGGFEEAKEELDSEEEGERLIQGGD